MPIGYRVFRWPGFDGYGLGPDVQEAQKRAYEAVDKIEWANRFCRRDIGGAVKATKLHAA